MASRIPLRDNSGDHDNFGDDVRYHQRVFL